jgi:DNA-binding transcriptional LysR family regulator
MRIRHAKLGSMADFTLTGLRIVHQIAATGSFTRAAEILGYTQSGVSRQVALMEAAAGTALFARGPRSVALTPAGQVLARHAGDVLAGMAAAHLELAGLRDRLAGRLSVGSFATAAMALTPRAAARLQTDHPGLAIVLHEASTPALLRQMRAGRLEVAVIGIGPGLPDYDLSGLRQTLLIETGLRVAVARHHRLGARTEVSVHDLTHEGWIVGDGKPQDPQFGAWPTLTAPHVVHTAGAWSTRLGLVAAGLGITVVPVMVLPALPAGVHAIAVIDSHGPVRAAVAVTSDKPSPRATAMIESLKIEAARLQEPASGWGTAGQN